MRPINDSQSSAWAVRKLFLHIKIARREKKNKPKKTNNCLTPASPDRIKQTNKHYDDSDLKQILDHDKTSSSTFFICLHLKLK